MVAAMMLGAFARCGGDEGPSDVCEPATCESLGAECGTHPDGCGATVSCPPCQEGEVCDGKLCVEECTPLTCADVEAECGIIDDGCGGTATCEECPAQHECRENVCVCVPLGCDDVGAQCGTIDDGCGDEVECDECPSRHECRDNVCECLPLRCEDLEAECGTIPDGCGGRAECESCPAQHQCIENTCVCVPLGSEDVEAECGTVDDGCGGEVQFDDCPYQHECVDNFCECVPFDCVEVGAECGTVDVGCGKSERCGTCPHRHLCLDNECVKAGFSDGEPCVDGDDCAGGICMTAPLHMGWEAGYCTGPCQENDECSVGAFCAGGPDGHCLVSCETDQECRAGYVCGDDGFGGQGCVRGAAGEAAVGEGCQGNWDCAGRERGLCIDDWPGGFCSLECDPEDSLSCPDGAECMPVEGMAPGSGHFCITGCGDIEDCRAEESYVCETLGGHLAIGMCKPACGSDHDCAFAEHMPYCKEDDGLCVECLEDAHCEGTCRDNVCVEVGNPDGAACMWDEDCAGYCLTEQSIGWRDGHCTRACLSDWDCSPGAICSPGYDDHCLRACETSADCRAEGYVCADDGHGRRVCVGGATGGGAPGDACAAQWECGGEEHGLCFPHWPGGYCMIDCSAGGAQDCPDGSECLPLDDGLEHCVAACVSEADCRSDEGYVCQTLDPLNEVGFCRPACASQHDCFADLPHCEVLSGLCVECTESHHCGEALECVNWTCVETGGDDGETCASDVDCDGYCIFEDERGWRDGYCSRSCHSDEDCSEGAVCSQGYNDNCFISCESDSDCRAEGYVCADDGTGLNVCVSGATGDGALGAACENYWDCAGREDGFCQKGDWPFGYCSVYCDPEADEPCPDGGECHRLGELDIYQCIASCEESADCRTEDGYVCDAGLCVPPCQSNEDCPSEQSPYCAVDLGLCVECTDDAHCGDKVCDHNACVDLTALDGEPCEEDDECVGFCGTQQDFGWLDGYCTRACVADADCGREAVCSPAHDNLCMRSCGSHEDCVRDGYICVDDGQGGGVCAGGAAGEGSVGDACEGQWDCGGYEYGKCLEDWLGGYCVIDCSAGTSQTCPLGSECLMVDAESGLSYCVATCDDADDCRTAEGYVCQGFGDMSEHDLCWPACLSNADCFDSGLAYCHEQSGLCVECVEDEHCGEMVCEDHECVAED